MQQILTEGNSDKTKQITNWFNSNFKGKLKFFRFKILKYKTPTFNRKIVFHLPRTITSDVVVLFSRRILRILCTIPPAML